MKNKLIISILCMILFTLPANAEYNRQALYVVGPTVDLQNDYLSSALTQEGFLITRSETIPEYLDEYDLVIVGSYSAAYRTTADYIKNYVASGGGVMITGGVPAFFPYTYIPHSTNQGYYDIGYISDWFGASRYANTGNCYARITLNNPLGTDLQEGNILCYSNVILRSPACRQAG